MVVVTVVVVVVLVPVVLELGSVFAVHPFAVSTSLAQLPGEGHPVSAHHQPPQQAELRQQRAVSASGFVRGNPQVVRG